MRDIVIVGTGGLAKDVKWIIDRINAIQKTWNLLGFIDKEARQDVIGDDDFLCSYSKELDVVIAVGSPDIRKKLYSKYSSNTNLCFPNVVDPSAIISASVTMGIGNIVCSYSVLTVDVTIGDFNIINIRSNIEHDSVIKDYVTVSPSVNVSGNVLIETEAYVGVGASIIQGLNIGKNTVIGAGAVVIKNIPANCTVVGVPAKPINFLEE